MPVQQRYSEDHPYGIPAAKATEAKKPPAKLRVRSNVFMFVVAILAVILGVLLGGYHNWYDWFNSKEGPFPLPNVQPFLEVHLDTMQRYDLALRGSYGLHLLNTRSALRDLETQVKYSDLSSENKYSFASALNLLWKETEKTAYDMEELEGKAAATFNLFIQQSRNIQRELIELGSAENKTKALQRLDNAFEEAMTQADDGMSSLDISVGKVVKDIVGVETFLHNAHEIYTKEKKVQIDNMKLLIEAWTKWGASHVETRLFEKNKQILNDFKLHHSQYKEDLNVMANQLRKFRAQVNTIRQSAKSSRLEIGNIGKHIKAINGVIDALEKQYNKYKTIEGQ